MLFPIISPKLIPTNIIIAVKFEDRVTPSLRSDLDGALVGAKDGISSVPPKTMYLDASTYSISDLEFAKLENEMLSHCLIVAVTAM